MLLLAVLLYLGMGIIATAWAVWTMRGSGIWAVASVNEIFEAAVVLSISVLAWPLLLIARFRDYRRSP